MSMAPEEQRADQLLEKLWVRPGFGEDQWLEFRDKIAAALKEARGEGFTAGADITRKRAKSVVADHWSEAEGHLELLGKIESLPITPEDYVPVPGRNPQKISVITKGKERK